LGVVDEDGDWPAFAPLNDCMGHLTKHLRLVFARNKLGHERREGTKGKSRRALCGGDSEREEA
jgi:hypothetical protein